MPLCFLISSRTRMKILKCGRISKRMKAKKHWKHSLEISGLISRTKIHCQFISSLPHRYLGQQKLLTSVGSPSAPFWLGFGITLPNSVLGWGHLSLPHWLLIIPKGRTGKYLGFFLYTCTLVCSQSTSRLCFEPICWVEKYGRSM